MSHARKLTLACLAACLVVAFAAAPTAMAAGSASASAKAGSGSATAQAALTKKQLARRIKAVRRSVRAINRILAGLADKTNTHENQIHAALVALQTIEPALLQLKAGLESAGAGLLQLKAGLESAGAAIKDLASSQEYGVIGVFAGTTRLPLTLTSSDIPDDGNSAAATGILPIPTGTNPSAGQLPGGTPLNMRAAIRSGENGDGDATGDPAGQVGGLLTLRCAAIDGSCDLDPGAGTVAVPTGAVVCTVGPPPNQTFNLPDGTSRDLPLKTIQEAATRTDTSRPNATDTNVAAGGPATGTGNSGNGSCSLGDHSTGDVYELTVQAQFVDLPTSTSPDIND